MKTTTNIFKSRVQAHIIDRLGNPWDEDTQSEKENATTAEKLKNVVDQFLSWWNPYEQRRIPNRQAAFIDFLLGLPGCLSIEYRYFAIRQIMQDWHEQTAAEAEKYTDDQVANNYYWLIYREFCTLCKKNKVEF